MTKATMKKTLKAWMKKYGISLADAVAVAKKNHKELLAVITLAETELMTEEMLRNAGL